MRALSASLCLLLLLTTFVLPLKGSEQETPPPPNPFAGFETRILANGLKVWYKHLPNDPAVSISVAVPFGSDRDPAGKEELAHFLEHMLFSEHLGRTDQQIRDEIKDRGGEQNGYTGSDRTFYFVHIGKEHGLFATEWLYRIVSPHAMDAAVVDRQREPVALEMGARPREFFDWLSAHYVSPPALRPPSFWQREFGLRTYAERDYYPYRSLYGISARDLRWFYDTYYVPSLMTLTVIGDLDRGAVLKKIEESFATLPARPEPAVPDTLRDPGRYRQDIAWLSRPNNYYRNGFKFYRPTAQQDVMLMFLSRLLFERLNAKLRFGERKATYGVGVGIMRRGPAEFFQIQGGIKKEEFAFARDTIERELEALRTGTLSQAEFARDRDAVARNLSIENTAAKDLEWWVSSFFYDPRKYRDLPDLVEEIAKISKEEVEVFARRHFVPRHQLLTIYYRLPFSEGLVVLLALALFWLSVRAARRLLIRPVDVSKMRYVARFQVPLLYKLALAGVILALAAIGFRLAAFGCQTFVVYLLSGVDNFWAQAAAYALMFVGMTFLLVLVPAQVPYKLQVFDDHLRIKYLSYRSAPLAAADITEISRRRFSEVWLSRRLWKCIPLAPGLFSPGIYLRRRNGCAYFFHARDPEQLMVILQDFVQTNRGDPGRDRTAE